MPIVPDTKDWTWVLRRPCPQCGFDASTFEPAEVAGKIRENAAQWPAVLARADAAVRPSPDVWSATEYAAHVRDVLRLFRFRVELMLQSDDPTFPSWDGDALAVSERYGEQEPARVAAELQAGGRRVRRRARGGAGCRLGAFGPPGRRRRVHGRVARPLLGARSDASPVGRAGLALARVRRRGSPRPQPPPRPRNFGRGEKESGAATPQSIRYSSRKLTVRANASAAERVSTRSGRSALANECCVPE